MPTLAVTRLEPQWKPLGYEETRWGKRYWLEVRGVARRLRPGDMWGISFLADIYPDLEYWRRQFPFGQSRRIDTARACTFFVKACSDAGEYQPPTAG